MGIPYSYGSADEINWVSGVRVDVECARKLGEQWFIFLCLSASHLAMKLSI
jgi:hypothetical protein